MTKKIYTKNRHDFSGLNEAEQWEQKTNWFSERQWKEIYNDMRWESVKDFFDKENHRKVFIFKDGSIAVWPYVLDKNGESGYKEITEIRPATQNEIEAYRLNECEVN